MTTTSTAIDLAALEALFGPVGEASIRKEVPSLHPVYRRWLEAAPFAVLATSGPAGLDASPRGDPAPLVTVQDEHTLLLPERRGNNRIDSLRNIVADPRVALLFMIPGVGETLRVNGRAHISVDPSLLQRLAMDGTPPKCVIVVHIETVRSSAPARCSARSCGRRPQRTPAARYRRPARCWPRSPIRRSTAKPTTARCPSGNAARCTDDDAHDAPCDALPHHGRIADRPPVAALPP
jgi:PPOX class probable FMN-dependent enzyme